MVNISKIVKKTLIKESKSLVEKIAEAVPKHIAKAIGDLLTVTVTIPSKSIMYHELVKYIRKHRQSKHNGQYEYDRKLKIDLSNHPYFISYNGTHIRFCFKREEKENAYGSSVTKFLELTVLSHQFNQLEGFLNTVSKNIKKENIDKTTVSIFDEGYWGYGKAIPQRKIKSVFIEREKMNDLIKTIQNFVDSKKWYEHHGIPYHLGILLHGKPGVGKSSIIKALAAYFGYSIYVMPSHKLLKIDEALESIPRKKCIMVIEDIDCSVGGLSREGGGGLLSGGDLSNILNAVDGIMTSHNHIIIMTTNHPDKLDPALIRPGRIDKLIEIGYVNLEILNQFLQRHFDKTIDGVTLKDEITCAQLQQMVLEKRSFDEIVQAVTIEGTVIK